MVEGIFKKFPIFLLIVQLPSLDRNVAISL